MANSIAQHNTVALERFKRLGQELARQRVRNQALEEALKQFGTVGDRLGLAPTEALVFGILLANGRVQREATCSVVYEGREIGIIPQGKNLDRTIYRIRRRLREHKIAIRTIPGRGYELDAENIIRAHAVQAKAGQGFLALRAAFLREDIGRINSNPAVIAARRERFRRLSRELNPDPERIKRRAAGRLRAALGLALKKGDWAAIEARIANAKPETLEMLCALDGESIAAKVPRTTPRGNKGNDQKAKQLLAKLESAKKKNDGEQIKALFAAAKAQQGGVQMLREVLEMLVHKNDKTRGPGRPVSPTPTRSLPRSLSAA